MQSVIANQKNPAIRISIISVSLTSVGTSPAKWGTPISKTPAINPETAVNTKNSCFMIGILLLLIPESISCLYLL